MNFMSEINRHGLSRDIPKPIKRQLRQECGFGCVCCGGAIITYEHIDPEFKDATEHDPQKMALLCDSCHGKVTRGIWSKDKIKAARSNPITFKQGLSKEAFDISDPFVLHLGTNSFEDVRTIVQTAEGEKWLSIEPPEAPGAPYRLSGKFYDVSGNLILCIDANEWICYSRNVWDLEIQGRRTIIRRAHRDIALLLEVEPPHGLRLRQLKMLKGTIGVEINEDTLSIQKGGFKLSFVGNSFGNVNTVVTI